jgi:hypothetical protein
LTNIAILIIGMICGGGFLLLLAALGIYYIYSGYKSRQKAGESQQWLSTTGQVIEARVTSSTTTDADGDTSVSYAPFVRYSYQVAEKEYCSDQITFGFKRTFSKEMNAHRWLDRFPLWSQVNVYYNPAKPDEAVLERKATGSTITVVLGIVFLVVSACIGCPVVVCFLYYIFRK